MEVILADVPVMFVLSENGVKGATKSFDLLESKLPSLKKRKFYGTVEGIPPNDTYRACVTIVEGDDPKSMGLEIWTIPGGKYERTKIENWEKNIKLIGKTFEAIIKEVSVDPTRPSIEFYRSMSEMFVLVAIK